MKLNNYTFFFFILFIANSLADNEPILLDEINEDRNSDTVKCLNLKNIVKRDYHPILLESDVLKIVDGIRGLMDETNVHKIICMGQLITKLESGIPVIDKETKKQTILPYNFENKTYKLSELALLESELEQKNEEKRLAELKTLLENIKEVFLNLTGPFLRDARGTRQQMFELIKEWSNKRKRYDTLLLGWMVGSEEISFRKNITSFQIFVTFNEDLTTFLKDLLYSCPKARQKFREKNPKSKL